MRFHDPDDEARLQAMVAAGAISREPLEAAVGNRSVGLRDALVEHEGAFPSSPWIAWGIRQGLARLHGAGASRGFLRGRKFSDAERNRCLENWRLPFGMNAFQQTLVAVVPGWDGAACEPGSESPRVVPCILTLGEMGALREMYRELW